MLIRTLFQIKCGKHFGQLAVYADAVVPRQILDQLLGNGGRPEGFTALVLDLLFQISQRSLTRAQKIHALVLPESLILYSNEGVDHGARHALNGGILVKRAAAAQRTYLVRLALSCCAIRKRIRVKARRAARARDPKQRVVHAAVHVRAQIHVSRHGTQHARHQRKHQQDRDDFAKFSHCHSLFFVTYLHRPVNSGKNNHAMKKNEVKA